MKPIYYVFIFILAGCIKSQGIKEYSYEGGFKKGVPSQPSYRTLVRVDSILKLPNRTAQQQQAAVPTHPVTSCDPDTIPIEARIESTEIVSLGSIFFALVPTILTTQRDDTSVTAPMTMQQYWSGCFFILVQDVPPGKRLLLDLYSDSSGILTNKRHLDYTSTQADTTNFEFQVAYTFL